MLNASNLRVFLLIFYTTSCQKKRKYVFQDAKDAEKEAEKAVDAAKDAAKAAADSNGADG